MCCAAKVCCAGPTRAAPCLSRAYFPAVQRCAEQLCAQLGEAAGVPAAAGAEVAAADGQARVTLPTAGSADPAAPAPGGSAAAGTAAKGTRAGAVVDLEPLLLGMTLRTALSALLEVSCLGPGMGAGAGAGGVCAPPPRYIIPSAHGVVRCIVCAQAPPDLPMRGPRCLWRCSFPCTSSHGSCVLGPGRTLACLLHMCMHSSLGLAPRAPFSSHAKPHALTGCCRWSLRSSRRQRGFRWVALAPLPLACSHARVLSRRPGTGACSLPTAGTKPPWLPNPLLPHPTWFHVPAPSSPEHVQHRSISGGCCTRPTSVCRTL